MLVLESFRGERPKGLDGCHRNGRTCDNWLDNLKWGTRAENMQDARNHGTAPRCERHGMAKLTAAQAAEIKALCAAGQLQRLTAVQYGISKAHVSYVYRHGWIP